MLSVALAAAEGTSLRRAAQAAVGGNAGVRLGGVVRHAVAACQHTPPPTADIVRVEFPRAMTTRPYASPPTESPSSSTPPSASAPAEHQLDDPVVDPPRAVMRTEPADGEPIAPAPPGALNAGGAVARADEAATKEPDPDDDNPLIAIINRIQSAKRKPSFWSSPVAWTFDSASDVVEATADVTDLASKWTSSSAKKILGGATEQVRKHIPRAEIPLPQTVKSAAGLLTNTAKAGTEWVSLGFGTVGNIAKGTGKFVVDVASDAIGEIPMSKSVNNTETARAIKRFGKTTFNASNKILGAVENVVDDVTSEGMKTASNVVKHTLGDDTGSIVEDVAQTGRSAYKSFYKVKTLRADKLIKSAVKDARKNAVKEAIDGLQTDIPDSGAADVTTDSRLQQQASLAIDGGGGGVGVNEDGTTTPPASGEEIPTDTGFTRLRTVERKPVKAKPFRPRVPAR